MWIRLNREQYQLEWVGAPGYKRARRMMVFLGINQNMVFGTKEDCAPPFKLFQNRMGRSAVARMGINDTVNNEESAVE